MDEQRLSRFLSLLLRHKPEAIGLVMDQHGWVDVKTLIKLVSENRKETFNFEILCQIVANDDKNRYAFNENKTKIRANQGHSIAVDVELKQMEPPDVLYHGTAEKYKKSIGHSGLIPKSRLYVHLSLDVETAKAVGKRHGAVVIYAVDSKKMREQGYLFYLSANNVWLTKEVPAKFLKNFTWNQGNW